MKNLFAIILILLVLDGCAVTPKFDNIEYDHFVKLLGHVQYTASSCVDPMIVRSHAQELVYEAVILDTYVTYRPAHKEIKEITVLVHANLKEMNDTYKSQVDPSTAYCVGKLKIIENSLKKVLPVIGDL